MRSTLRNCNKCLHCAIQSVQEHLTILTSNQWRKGGGQDESLQLALAMFKTAHANLEESLLFITKAIGDEAARNLHLTDFRCPRHCEAMEGGNETKKP